ncbi:MAG TPA: sigma 54-interacting transcriptional regulator, partial [Thermoanaerobaculia bacterium]|nr:sigma 54-interacting transcriptional regulator [Thermoanaerobaculia bacterium]
VDARIIAATNQNVEERIQRGSFREDLYYRINVIPIPLPALRERREDIPALVDFFLAKYSREMEVPMRRISVEAMRLLEGYDWPGNVRELENLIERAVALSPSEVVTAQDLPPQVRGQPAGEREASVALPDGGLDLEAYLDQLRAQLMAQALERAGGVQTQAAELLGMTFRSFRYYAKKLGLTGGEEVAAGDDA